MNPQLFEHKSGIRQREIGGRFQLENARRKFEFLRKTRSETSHQRTKTPKIEIEKFQTGIERAEALGRARLTSGFENEAIFCDLRASRRRGGVLGPLCELPLSVLLPAVTRISGHKRLESRAGFEALRKRRRSRARRLECAFLVSKTRHRSSN